MENVIRITLFVSCFSILSQGQVLTPPTKAPDDIINGAFKKEHNQQKQNAYEYPEINEKDIVWSTTIWREIDLRQKMNHHFYYPAIGDRTHLNVEQMSLIDVIMESIQEGGLFYDKSNRVFKAEQNAKADNEFKYGLLSEEEKLLLGSKEGTKFRSYDSKGKPMFNEDGSPKYEYTESVPFNRTSVKKWKVKEEWFFDKHRSTMDVRIIGLCPVQYIEDEDRDEDMFWIYFPDYRDLLARTKVTNFTKNNAQQRSYLGIFEKRMFASRILQESNIMNRGVTEYMVGLDALLESEKITNDIFNLEQDLWEY